MKCAECGVPLEHDTEAEAWLRREVLFDPDAVDVDNAGTSCQDGEEHVGTFDADCGSGMCDPNTGCPECNDPPPGGWVRRS